MALIEPLTSIAYKVYKANNIIGFFVVLKFCEWLILSFSQFYFHEWSSQIPHVSCSMATKILLVYHVNSG